MLRRWWRHRRFQYFLGALPALVVIGAASYLAAAASFMSPDEIGARYAQAAARAFETAQFAQARVCFQRLIQLEREQPGDLFQLALTADKLGDNVLREGLIFKLAPRDRLGHGPAHLWRARHLLAGPQVSREAALAAEAHLRWALRAHPTHLEVHAVLGSLLMATGRPDGARRHLQRAVSAAPALRLQLAIAYAQLGDTTKARAEGEKARQFFRDRAEADLNNLDARLQWAEATMFLEEFAASASLLREGLLIRDNPAYRRALARVYVAWSDHLGRDPAANPAERLQLLQQGLRADPSEIALFHRLMDVLNRGDATADGARASLTGLLAAGQAVPLVHLLLGTDAGERGDIAQALQHLEQAHRLDPGMPIIANNLAWFLAHREPPDLPRAFALVDTLAKRWPNVPDFRDTRGQILVKMRKWKKALTDLEAALPAMANNPHLHRALAEVYRNLQMPELAAEHERLAQQTADVAKSTPAASP